METQQSHAEKKKHNSLGKVLTGDGKDGKAGQLCPSIVKNYLFLKKEACFPRWLGKKRQKVPKDRLPLILLIH